jgi:hypothetical protein
MGANFALLEASVIATMVTQRFVLDVPAACVVPEATVTLRFANRLVRDPKPAKWGTPISVSPAWRS